MKLLSSGGQLFVTTEEWHNKTLGRSPIRVIYRGNTLKENIEKEWFVWYVGYSLKEVLQHYFPWANIGIDEEFYEENFSEFFYDVYTDKYIRNHEIYPYEVLAGEVSNYRLELKLNQLGKSFLTVLEYLEG